MIKTQQKIRRKIYLKPEIISVKLDNEISLALESNPPDGPFETQNTIQTSNTHPFKNQNG
jgi:hypothetical protein